MRIFKEIGVNRRINSSLPTAEKIHYSSLDANGSSSGGLVKCNARLLGID